MIYLSGRRLFQRRSFHVFRRNLARRILAGNFRYAVIHQLRLFRIRHARIQSDYFGYMGIRVLRGQFPTYLYDSAVYLDAEKIFRLSGYGYRCPECDYPVNVGHGGLTDKCIAIP